MKVVLHVDEGPGEGRSFEVGEHVYRAIGRQGDSGALTTLVSAGEPELDAEEQRIVEAHLARRRAQSATGARPREGSFRRGADILLDDALTSRTHAMVFVDEEGPSVVDLGSTNGTFVNAKPISDAALQDGDVLHIGRARFLISVRSGR